MRYPIIVLSILLMGCKATERVVTIHETETIRDTVIETQLRDTTIFRTDTLLRDTLGLMYSDTVSASGRYADAFAWVWNSELQLKLEEGKVAEVPSQVIEKVKVITETEVKTKIEYKVHWYDYAARGIAIFVIIALLFALKFVRLR